MNRKNLFNKGETATYNFWQFDKRRPFGKNILHNKFALDNSNKGQPDILSETINVSQKAKLKNFEKKIFKVHMMHFLETEKSFWMVLEVEHLH